jgi:peptidoglycan/LPS O-acetylase OafA/YrhL
MATISFLGIIYIKYNPGDSFIFVGGFTLIALLAGVIVLSAAIGTWIGGRVISIRPLRVLGMISYGLYSWHALIFRVFARHVHSGPQSFRILLALAVTAVFVTASWFFVEKPFLRLKDRKYGHAAQS